MTDYNSKYSGEQVEALLDQVASGNAGGGGSGGITEETDPIFLASPAAGITEDDKKAWNNKVDVEDINDIKPLIVNFSINDIAAYVNNGTEFNYHHISIIDALQNKQPIYIPYENEGVEGYYAAYGFIDDFIYLDVFFGNTVYKLELYAQGGGIANISERNSNNFVSESDLANIALTGDYNDLENKPTIPSAVTESTVSGWGFTKNAGTYSKPSTGIPKSDLTSEVQESLEKAKNAVSAHKAGELIAIDIQAINDNIFLYGFPTTANGDEDDILLSQKTVKTINGESIYGSGNITISGGSGNNSILNWKVGSLNYEDGVVTLEPFVLYYTEEISGGGTVTIYPTAYGGYNEWRIIFYTDGETAIEINSDVLWANGTPPDISTPGIYELSLADNDGVVLAVITPFKYVE